MPRPVPELLCLAQERPHDDERARCLITVHRTGGAHRAFHSSSSTLVLRPSLRAHLCATCRSHRDLVEETSRNVRPAPELRSAAEDIVANLSAGGGAAATWDGLYLPLKLDARATRVTGGDEARAGQSRESNFLQAPP